MPKLISDLFRISDYFDVPYIYLSGVKISLIEKDIGETRQKPKSETNPKSARIARSGICTARDRVGRSSSFPPLSAGNRMLRHSGNHRARVYARAMRRENPTSAPAPETLKG